jgi:hypothetical protein
VRFASTEAADQTNLAVGDVIAEGELMGQEAGANAG